MSNDPDKGEAQDTLQGNNDLEASIARTSERVSSMTRTLWAELVAYADKLSTDLDSSFGEWQLDIRNRRDRILEAITRARQEVLRDRPDAWAEETDSSAGPPDAQLQDLAQWMAQVKANLEVLTLAANTAEILAEQSLVDCQRDEVTAAGRSILEASTQAREAIVRTLYWEAMFTVTSDEAEGMSWEDAMKARLADTSWKDPMVTYMQEHVQAAKDKAAAILRGVNKRLDEIAAQQLVLVQQAWRAVEESVVSGEQEYRRLRDLRTASGDEPLGE